MVRSISIVDYGKVQTNDRPRVTVNPRTGRGRSFDTQRNRTNKGRIYAEAVMACESQHVSIPIPSGSMGYTVSILVEVVPPKSYTKKKLREIQEGMWRPVCKPDLDNVQKLWLDGLKGIIDDDKNVTSIYARRIYSDVERVTCTVSWVEKDKERI